MMKKTQYIWTKYNEVLVWGKRGDCQFSSAIRFPEHTGLGRNLMYDPAQNEPELGQGFTLSSSRPSQSIPGVILRLVRSCILIT